MSTRTLKIFLLMYLIHYTFICYINYLYEILFLLQVEEDTDFMSWANEEKKGKKEDKKFGVELVNKILSWFIC